MPLSSGGTNLFENQQHIKDKVDLRTSSCGNERTKEFHSLVRLKMFTHFTVARIFVLAKK